MPTLDAIRQYYVDTTRTYASYSQGTGGWHFGLWEPGITTAAEAIVASNTRMVAGLAIDETTHILDAGCGSGAFAIWAARTFGCRVTGLTIVPVHVALAKLLAASAGVGHLCDFQHMDMTALSFPPETFDVVTNQESWCHVDDKLRYLRDVHRVLRPGGSWRALEYVLPERPLTTRGERWHRQTCDGWHLCPLTRRSEGERIIGETGFHLEATEDLSALVLPHVEPYLKTDHRKMRAIRRQAFLHDLRLLGSLNGHYAGALAFMRALTAGEIGYVRYSASKP
jgi:cyclopropane fatty-acyl-phospholipid synthase-like methyltransferase